MKKRREKSGEIVKEEALFIEKIKILFYLSFTILPSFYYFTLHSIPILLHLPF
jgi:hypothetical protein